PLTQLASEDHFFPVIIIAAPHARLEDPSMTTLSVVRELVSTRDIEVCVLLKRGGPLVKQFCSLAPTVVIEEEDAVLADSDVALDDLLATLFARGADAALCYGLLTSDMTERLKSHGLRVITAIHELPGIVRPQEFCNR